MSPLLLRPTYKIRIWYSYSAVCVSYGARTEYQANENENENEARKKIKMRVSTGSFSARLARVSVVPCPLCHAWHFLFFATSHRPR